MKPPCWAVAAAAVCLSLLSSSPSRVDAKPPPRVLMVPYQLLGDDMPPDLAEQTTIVVAKEVAHGDIAVVQHSPRTPTGAARPSDRPTGDPKAGPRAARWLDRARVAVEDAEFDRAIEAARRAIQLLERNGDAVRELPLLSEAYLWAGIAYFRDGQDEEGDEMLARAVHYAPERRLEPADFPPIFVRVYDRARYNVLRRPRARIEIKGPAGGAVIFDGRNMGSAPLLLTDVLPGRHWIRVERPGADVRVETLEVRGRSSRVVDFEGPGASAAKSDVLAAIRANSVTTDDVHRLREAGRRARAGHVTFGGVYKTNTAYRVRSLILDVETGQVGRLADIAFDLDMLTAEIEVYKLAEDVRAQVRADAFARPVDAAAFEVAPKYRSGARERQPATPTARAAPPPPDPPASVYAQPPPPAVNAPPPPARAESRDRPELVPKDEREEQARAAATSAVDDDGASLWWLWVTIGIVAAGAGTGAFFLLNGDDADEGTVRVRW